MLKKPTVVIFDMDGTTVRHVNPAFLGFLEMLDNLIHKLSKPFKKTRQLKDYSRNPAHPRGLLVHRAIHKLRPKDVGQIVQPCPGIYDLLKYLKSQNIPVALASNGLGKGYGHEILKTFHLSDFFDAEIFREDVQKSKPHPDGIMRALRAVKPDFNENDIVWHIGDRAKDITATLAANQLTNCHITPFSYGIKAAISILKNNIGNNHIIMNYPEFLSRIRKDFEDIQDKEKDLAQKKNEKDAA